MEWHVLLSLVGLECFGTCSGGIDEVYFGISGRILVLKEELLLELK